MPSKNKDPIYQIPKDDDLLAYSIDQLKKIDELENQLSLNSSTIVQHLEFNGFKRSIFSLNSINGFLDLNVNVVSLSDDEFDIYLQFYNHKNSKCIPSNHIDKSILNIHRRNKSPLMRMAMGDNLNFDITINLNSYSGDDLKNVLVGIFGKFELAPKQPHWVLKQISVNVSNLTNLAKSSAKITLKDFETNEELNDYIQSQLPNPESDIFLPKQELGNLTSFNIMSNSGQLISANFSY